MDDALPGPIRLQLETFVERLGRQSINHMEEARLYAELKRQGWAQRDIAARIDRGQPYVCKRLKLLTLPEDMQRQVEDGTLPPHRALYHVERHSVPLDDDVFERLAEYARVADVPVPELVEQAVESLLSNVGDFATADN